MKNKMTRISLAIQLLLLAILAAIGHSAQVDHRVSDVIAENILNFGHSVGLELAALDTNASENQIFSPISLTTALSLLTLGAKSKSYQELNHVLGIDSDSELIQNPNKYHEEFGLMLNDLQRKNLNRAGINKRQNANWRFTNLERRPEDTKPFSEPVEHIIKVANGLFVQNGYSLNPYYSQVLKSIYDTEFAQLDFLNRNAEARDYINDWVKNATVGRIPKVITDHIEKSTKIILASTLYFKAFWQKQFYPAFEDNFFPDGEHNSPIKIQMMPIGGVFPFYDAKEYDCRIIGLPYRGNETTMYVIQPTNSTRQRLRNLQYVLDAHKINNMINNMERKSTVMIFPKMHFKRRIDMKNILLNMSVHDIFVNGYSDLSLIGQRPQNGFVDNGQPAKPTQAKTIDPSFQSIFRKRPVYDPSIYDTKFLQDIDALALSNLESSRQTTDSYKSDLYVDDIIHNVDFSVDEQGTEAAAVTLTSIKKSGSDVIFRGNTPFLIVIRHDPTKLPLFYGVINKPEL